MASRVAITLLLLDRDKVVRADFGSGARPEVRDLWQQPRPAVDDFGLLVESALHLGPHPGKRVWVLSGDLWTQTLPLPLLKVDGISEDELSQALAFEVEPLSGVPALE